MVVILLWGAAVVIYGLGTLALGIIVGRIFDRRDNDR